MIRKYKITRGLTLIELLVAATIATFIGLGIYKIFSNGITVWRWIDANQPNIDSMIFFEKAANDLRNYCYVSEKSFVGTKDTLTFFVHESDLLLLTKKELIVTEIGLQENIYKVEYSYSPSKRAIKRTLYAFGTQHPLRSSIILRGISEMSFSYYFLEGYAGDIIEAEDVNDIVPHAVKVQVEFEDDSINNQAIQKIILLPLGSKY